LVAKKSLIGCLPPLIDEKSILAFYGFSSKMLLAVLLFCGPSM
jgi:hypothetical protein